ncbi:MAG: NRDE family protein, partial [Myxococcales bacterium]
MCTLVLAHKVFPGAPLVVAANRDEFLDRPSSGPRVYAGAPRVLMPRDEVAKGTWLGLNEHGLFVGITNRAGHPNETTRRSRGEIVAHALRARTARELHRQMGLLAPGTYNAFHLLYADGQDAFVSWSNGRELAQYNVAPGVHVVTERSLGADDRGRTERLEAHFRADVAGHAPTLARLKTLLTLHGTAAEPMSGSCIHAPGFNYGTRSSLVYVSGPAPMAAWSEGPACEGRWADITPLVRELMLA